MVRILDMILMLLMISEVLCGRCRVARSIVWLLARPTRLFVNTWLCSLRMLCLWVRLRSRLIARDATCRPDVLMRSLVMARANVVIWLGLLVNNLCRRCGVIMLVRMCRVR